MHCQMSGNLNFKYLTGNEKHLPEKFENIFSPNDLLTKIKPQFPAFMHLAKFVWTGGGPLISLKIQI